MRKFSDIKKRVLDLLEKRLPHHLTYHSVEHTLYVIERSEYIANKEGVSKKDISLLKIAALFHDTGFIFSPVEHEKRSCKIARKELKDFDFSKEELDLICGMIMATRIPQTPHTHLEAILADADLEYLATNEFKKIGDMLYEEIKSGNTAFTKKAWNQLQIDFITKHSYHTTYCKRYKERYKQKNLDSLKQNKPARRKRA